MARYLVACDAGGTMTDVIVVDERGRFVIGKAPTTRYDESVGYMESLDEALSYLRIGAKDRPVFFRSIETAIYTGTSMLNALINLDGLTTGLLVTRGFEDMIAQGRGSQSFIDCQWSEITHMQYRKHRVPLVPRRLTRGVTERIDLFGQVVIPLYEHEVERGVRELLGEGIEALAIVFLQSFTNGAHEQRAAQIARRVIDEAGRNVPVVVSCEVAPTLREISRANATVIQAYASEPARKQLVQVEDKLVAAGYAHSLKTVLCYGGVTSIRYPRLFETVMSGPVGGMMGGAYVAKVIGEQNVVCSDVGGTSFDAGAITAGIVPIDREPPFQQMYVNVPMLDIRSIGAGTGTYIRLDPETKRIKLGPDSAGGTPGPVFQESGNDDVPTVNDCNLLLGILNEHYYLGGRVKVNPDKSLRVFREKIADPLGLDPYIAAEQCVDLVNVVMREHLVRSLMVGHDLRDYVLLGYGGGGPLHLLGYAGDAPWKSVITVPHAGAFSAWGGACMDYAHRRHKSVSAVFAAREGWAAAARSVTAAWQELETELLEELLKEGFSRDQVVLEQIAYMRYFGQLRDVEVSSPVPRLHDEGDVERLVGRFEEVFTKMFTLAGRPPQPTYHVAEVSVVARVDTVKPKLARQALEGKKPPRSASKGTRRVFQKGRWHTAQIFEMEELRPGNEVSGLAVIEAPNTTLFVPHDWHLRIDEHLIYWLTRTGARRPGKGRTAATRRPAKRASGGRKR
ncbi:MAG: hydantoinase/oxoprolinase family protein [Deltaproteobacteria bacterium]|nr:hydantoinase/oxoprolinase family protein [Deltaproteobacteria bacterium]